MTDTPPVTAAPAAVPTEAPNAQLIVSLGIVVVLGLLGLALILAGVYAAYAGKDGTVAWAGVGTIVGALATALNAPSGIANMLTAAKKEPGQ
jgi:hypothetical protein